MSDDPRPLSKQYETLQVLRDGAITTLVMNRPAVRNAFNPTMRDEIRDALTAMEADGVTRVLLLTGAGGHFCAGGDVKLMQAAKRSIEDCRAELDEMGRMVLQLAEFPRPTIAVVDGVAVGAGCNLALCCDLIVASDRARFGEVFARVGLVPDGGGTYFLPRLVGLARAKELVFTAGIIDAARAERLGLVNSVVPAAELASAARTLAATIAAGPPAALAMAKRMLNRSVDLDLAGVVALEAEHQSRALVSEEHQEGLRAFFEKRAPSFRLG